MAHALHAPFTAPRLATHVPAPALVQWLEGRAAFDALAPEWDALVARTDDQLFYRHAFLSLWLDAFAPGARLAVLVQREGGRLVAALPLLRRRLRVCGLPARAWCAPANLHSCRSDLLAEDPAAAARAFAAALAARRDWDLVQLCDVPPGGRAERLLAAAPESGLLAGRWASLRPPYVALPATMEALERRLGSKHRTALRSRRRRLAARGRVTLERIAGGDRMEQALAEGLALEASGWKGRAGTAIRQHPATLRFYTTLAQEAADRGALALWFLRVDGRAVAFQYLLEHRDRCLLLKQAYDEAWRDCGPGQLLMEDVLRAAIRRGFAEFDLLGDDAPAKRLWTDRTRQHGWIFLFRGPWGRLLHALKFRVAPWLRRRRAARA